MLFPTDILVRYALLNHLTHLRMRYYSRNKSFSYILLSILYILYVTVFALYHDRVGTGIAWLAIIPVVCGSWYFGAIGGMLTAILCILGNGFVHLSSEHSHITFPIAPGIILSTFALLFVAFVVGRLGTVTRERREALCRLEKRVKQLTILHEVALISTQVESIDKLIERTTEIIGKYLFPDNFGVLLMDEEKGLLRPHSSYRYGISSNRFPNEIPLGRGITGQVAQTSEPIRIRSVYGIHNYINIDQRTSAELCVPIKLKDRVLGVINAESTSMDAFSTDDELLLGTLAGQLATTIEQLRAVEAERQWLDQLTHSNGLIYALAHITTHIEKALSANEIFRTIGEELNKIDLICITTVYDKDRSLFTVNYTSMEPIILEQVENAIGFPLIEYNFSLEQLNSILKFDLHPAFITHPEDEFQLLFTRLHKVGISEILQVMGPGPETELFRLPLVFEENLLGILWIWGKGIIRADLPIMSIFAKQIGSSLERARLFQEVQSLALIDPLTGLQNRRSLFELGRIEFSRTHHLNRPFCCMMLDLDYFKQVNDSYGHLVGDQVLEEFATRCKNSVRAGDLIGRYGGEEFVILLPETDLDTALHVAERLRASIEKTPIKVSDQEISTTVSVGVATKDENTLDLQTLIARADQAMYVAKYRGRNRIATSK